MKILAATFVLALAVTCPAGAKDKSSTSEYKKQDLQVSKNAATERRSLRGKPQQRSN
jgi:hypothetical protein